jgi:replicative superfamily II helicase
MNILQWIKSWFKKEEPKKLVAYDTKKIVIRYINGESQRSIAQAFGITQPKVSYIINNSKLFADHKKREAREKRSRSKRNSR